MLAKHAISWLVASLFGCGGTFMFTFCFVENEMRAKLSEELSLIYDSLSFFSTYSLFFLVPSFDCCTHTHTHTKLELSNRYR